MKTLFYRIKILKNPIFYRRYIMQHTIMMQWGAVFGYDRNKRFARGLFYKIARICFERYKLMFFYKFFIILRFLCGKIDIPYMQIVVTTRCTLQCKDCHDLMPYFSIKNHYSGQIHEILKNCKILLDNVDSIVSVRILGGEPLLFKDIVTLVDFLVKEPKIKSFDIITNGTIQFSDTLLSVLKNCHKVRVIIDDYTHSTQKVKAQDIQTITNSLHKNDIRHFVLDWNKQKWFDAGLIYKRNRTKEEIIKNFLACGMYCVSLIGGKNDELGKIFICPRASSMSKLYDVANFIGDYIDIASKTLRADIIYFYTKNYFQSCDYCQDMSLPKISVEAGVQIAHKKEIYQ